MDAHSLAEFTESAVAFERLIRRAILRLADELEMTADDLPGDLAPVHAEPPKSRYCEADARYYGLTPGFDLPRPLPIEVRIDQLGRAMQRAVTIRRTLAALISASGSPLGPQALRDALAQPRRPLIPLSDANEDNRPAPQPSQHDALAQPRRAFSPAPDSPHPETAPEDRPLGPQTLRDSVGQSIPASAGSADAIASTESTESTSDPVSAACASLPDSSLVPRRRPSCSESSTSLRPLPPVSLTFPVPTQPEAGTNSTHSTSRTDSAPRLLPILPPAPFLAPAARQTPAALSQALQNALSNPTLLPCGTAAPAEPGAVSSAPNDDPGAVSSAPAGHSSGSTASSQPAPNDEPGAVSSAPADLPGPPDSPYADFPPLTPAEQRIADRARRHHFPDGAPPDLHPRFGLKYIPDDVIRRRHAGALSPADLHWFRPDDDDNEPPP